MKISTMDNPPPIHVDGRSGRAKHMFSIQSLAHFGNSTRLSYSLHLLLLLQKDYPGGKTTHYLYGIPVDEYKPFLKLSVGPRVTGRDSCR
jgi:hypothetical protein